MWAIFLYNLIMDKKDISKLAFKFVLLVGVVNLFADMTYEGARSINGAFLASLGASAIIVSVVSGLGEFLGYVLRSIAGFFADKSHKYWVFSFVGYTINLFAVPALALAGNWPMAAALIILENGKSDTKTVNGNNAFLYQQGNGFGLDFWIKQKL